MPDMQRNPCPGWKNSLLILVIGLTLLACQFPALLINSIRKSEPNIASTPTISPSPVKVVKKTASITPTSIVVEPTEQQNLSEDDLTQTAVSEVTGEYPYIGESTIQPGQATTDVYPVLSPEVQETSPEEYTSVPTNSTYPGETTPLLPYNPYPVETASATTQLQTQMASATASPTPTTTIRPPTTATRLQTGTVIVSPATATSTAFSPEPLTSTLATSTPTQTATFFVPTITPTPSATRFLTPTPTPTFTPTPTRTPLPYPPWLSVQIYASDSEKVRLAAGKPQLIMFFAYWSGPSLAMAPIVKGIEKEYCDRVNFIYLDIDNPLTASLKQALHYRSEPHFFIVDSKGKVLREWVGYVSVEQLREAIEAALIK